MTLRLDPRDRRLLRGGAAWLDRAKTPLDEAALLAHWSAALARRGTPGSPETISVYVHVPFCRSRCSYCKEPSQACRQPRQLTDYVSYVEARLARVRTQLGRIRASSLYIGGGTPSMLPVDDLTRLLGSIEATFRADGDVTFEANPDSLSEEKIALATRHGINRISLGVQSTHAAVLTAVRRTNPSRETIAQQVRAALSSGAAVNVDLMSGLPSQSAASVMDDLAWAMQAGPHSITLYRYQRQPDTAAAPDGIAFRDLPWRRLVARSLALGYLPFYTGSPDAASATFIRPALRTMRPLRAGLRRLGALAQLARASGLQRPLPAHAALAHYTVFDASPIHIMGFGPRSISRLFGRGWYRDDTPPLLASATIVPRFVGERISLQTELDRAMAADLIAGRWVRRGDYRAAMGIDPRGVLEELPAELGPAVERRRTQFRLRSGHPAAEGVLAWFLLRMSG